MARRASKLRRGRCCSDFMYRDIGLLLGRIFAKAVRFARQSAVCQLATLAVVPFCVVSGIWWAVAGDLILDAESDSGQLPCQSASETKEFLRVCIVASSFQGIVPSSGIGTFYSALAEALVRAGHSVTLLFTQGNVSHSVEGNFAYWHARYLQKGIEMVPLQKMAVEGVMYHARTAWSVYRWLRDRSHLFDIIHVHDYQGHGYYTVLAKYLGIAFNKSIIVVMTHGPLRWARTANGQALDSLETAEVDFLEQQTVRLADIVLSPSEYLLRWAKLQGWSLRSEPQVMPLLVPSEARKLLEELAAAISDLTVPRRVDELVFFGRLEGRKGIVEFCDSVDALLGRGRVRLSKVAFLGGSASTIRGQPSREYLLPRTERWRGMGVEVEIFDDKDTRGALTYLLGGKGGRCAVLPSRSENSPMVVTELLAAKVPFLASNVGGIPELIAEESHETTLFQAKNGTALTEAISRALEHGVLISQAAHSLGSLETSWIDWHHRHARGCARSALRPRRAGGSLRGSVFSMRFSARRSVVACILHSTQRPADLKATYLSLVDQDPAMLSGTCLVLVGTATEESERIARALSEGAYQSGSTHGSRLRVDVIRAMRRSDGIQKCTASWASSLSLLVEAGTVFKPGALRTMASRLVQGDGGITAAAHPYEGSVRFDKHTTPQEVRGELAKHRDKTRLFLGPAVRSGIFGNVFGGDFVLLAAAMIQELEGLRALGEGHGFWELLAAAAVRGREVQAIPEPLCWMRDVRAPPRGISDLKRLLKPMRHNFSDATLRDILKGSKSGVEAVMGAPELPMAIAEY